MITKLKLLLERYQKEGIPLVFVKDPVTKKPSVSLTLLLISFTINLFSLINKFAKLAEGVDTENSLQLLIVCASLYFGRSLSKKMK
jgi:hypothetical protein